MNSNSGQSMDLLSAVSLGDYSLVEHYLRTKPDDVNKVNAQGWTPVMYAANYGHFNIIRLLIRHNCDVNHKDWSGRTALMLAASNGHTRCLDALINYGDADKTLKDVSGNDAYKYAKNCGHGNNKLIKALLLKRDSYQLRGRSSVAPTPVNSPVPLIRRIEMEANKEDITQNGYNPLQATPFSYSGGTPGIWAFSSIGPNSVTSPNVREVLTNRILELEESLNHLVSNN